MPTTYIANTDHYNLVLSHVASVRKSLWIGTADIKDLYVLQARTEKPFLGVLSDLLGKGVEVRLIHAKEPGPNFRADFNRYPRLARLLERALCPRVHFKIIVIDYTICYVGSANLTGAGMGMKSPHRRNFEAGILTNETELVQQAMKQFDEVWMGLHCKNCKRRQFCSDPIV